MIEFGSSDLFSDFFVGRFTNHILGELFLTMRLLTNSVCASSIKEWIHGEMKGGGHPLTDSSLYLSD